MSKMLITTQNVQGLGQKIDEMISNFHHRGVYAACMQETNSDTDGKYESYEIEVENGSKSWVILHIGTGKGTGVAIALSPRAAQAWRKGGAVIKTYGTRIILVKLKPGGDQTLALTSQYRPHGARPAAERTEYDTQFDLLSQECKAGEILASGQDVNCDLGTGHGQRDAVCGQYGIPKRTKAGDKYRRRLHACGLTSTATLFRKTPRGEWPEDKFDPRYHAGGKRETAHDTFTSRFGPQQLDHLFVSTAHKGKISDAAAANWGVDSDHRLVFCVLQMRSSVATYRYGTDLEILKSPEVRDRFLLQVKQQHARLQALNVNGDSSLDLIYQATQFAVAKVLRSKVHVRAPWFEASKTVLLPLVEQRNASSTKIERSQARKVLVAAKKKAKLKWHADRIQILTKGKDDGESLSPKKVWALIYETAGGADHYGRRKTTKIQFNVDQAAGPAGGTTDTAEEAASVFEKWGKTKFDQDGEHEKVHTLMQQVRQRSDDCVLDKRPTEADLKWGVRGLGNGKSGGKAKMPAEIWKAFEHDGTTKQYIRDHVLHFWDKGRKQQQQPPTDPPPLDPDPEPPPPNATRPRFTLHPPPPARRCRRCALEVLAPRGRTPKYQTVRAPLPPLPYDHATLACDCPPGRRYCREHFGCEHPAHGTARQIKAELKDAGLKTTGALPALRQRASDLHREQARQERGEDVHDCPGCMCAHEEWEDATHPAPRQGVHGEERGFCYPEWLQAQVVLLHKKGDKGQCKNWRAISLLDIASKVLSRIMTRRLHVLLGRVSTEDQNGFMRGRGCADATFSVLQGLRKRKEHGLGSWVAWIDLIRAFDSVPREVLWACASRLGVGPVLLDALKRIHEGANIEVDIDGATARCASRLGVRQGAVEGPLLCLCVFQCALESCVYPASMTPPLFYTSEDGVVTGEKHDRKQGAKKFEFTKSLYADDAALVFSSREDMEIGLRVLIAHMRTYGLQAHVGSATQQSKTECQYFPPKGETQEDGNTSPIELGNGEILQFTTLFKYLGTTISSELTADAEIRLRVRKAQGAFSAMRSVLTDRDLPLKTRGNYYKVLVLTVLLFGSESWAVTAKHLDQLAVFHRKCVRAMAHTSMWKTRVHRVTTASLLEKAGIAPLIHYFDKRLLQWAGKLARMPLTRMPRRMMTAWAPHSRPRGMAKSWGQTLNDCLKRNGVPTRLEEWVNIARGHDNNKAGEAVLWLIEKAPKN